MATGADKPENIVTDKNNLHFSYISNIQLCFSQNKKYFSKQEKIMGYPLLSLFQKIKIVQAMHNVSDSDIRDCIGKDRYYNIEKEKADLPLGTTIKFFELCNLSDTEKLWFLDKDATDYPVPKNILNEIRELRSAVERQQAENKNPQPPHTQESSTHKAGAESEKLRGIKIHESQPP